MLLVRHLQFSYKNTITTSMAVSQFILKVISFCLKGATAKQRLSLQFQQSASNYVEPGGVRKNWTSAREG